MKNYIILMSVVLFLSACGKKEQYNESQTTIVSPVGFTHKSVITGRSCVNGFSMIRVDFSGESWVYTHDTGTWVYEVRKDSSANKVRCS